MMYMMFMMTRLYPGQVLPQFQERATRKWEQMDPGTEGLTVPKTIKTSLVRPLMTHLKVTIELTVRFLHVAAPTTPSLCL